MTRPGGKIIIYEVEQIKKEVQVPKKSSFSSDKKEAWMIEKKNRAFKMIHNASVLNEVVENISSLKSIKENESPVVKDAVEKLNLIIDELKLNFKKDYWE